MKLYKLVIILIAAIISSGCAQTNNDTKTNNNSEEILEDEKVDVMPTLTEQEAINLVNDLAEVQEWLALSGGKPVIEIDHKEDEFYIIHAYESMPDHTATFNWYRVHSKTGEVSNMFQ